MALLLVESALLNCNLAMPETTRVIITFCSKAEIKRVQLEKQMCSTLRAESFLSTKLTPTFKEFLLISLALIHRYWPIAALICDRMW